MTGMDFFYICPADKDGCPCGFALCALCKDKYVSSSSGRGARQRGVRSGTGGNQLSQQEKMLLTDCHDDVAKLQQRDNSYFGSGRDCIKHISNTRVYNCAKCHKFHHALKGKMDQIPELKTRFGL